MRRSARVCLSRFGVYLVLAVLVVPGTAVAKGKPEGAGGGNGQFNTQGYWVWFSQDALGAFEPEGLPPASGVVANDVVAGAVRDEDDPQMRVHSNQSCLENFSGGMETVPSALQNANNFVPVGDFEACFPEGDTSQGSTTISADGKTVQMYIHGRSNSGRTLGYYLTIQTNAGDGWNPLDLARGSSVTLLFGAWTLTTENPKKQSKGCSASGNFSDQTAITVQRWTEAEQIAQDACE